MSVKYTKNYDQVKKELNARKKRMLEAVGKAGEGYVKLNTVVDTGALRDSIAYKVDEDGVYIGSTLTGESYPIFIELGTSRMPAQSYLKSGIMNNLNSLKNIAEKNFK